METFTILFSSFTAISWVSLLLNNSLDEMSFNGSLKHSGPWNYSSHFTNFGGNLFLISKLAGFSLLATMVCHWWDSEKSHASTTLESGHTNISLSLKFNLI